MTETRTGNTFSKLTAIHRSWRKLRGGICRYKTFCMRIFARRTFLRFRYCSIHVKIHVLLTYSAVKRRVSMGSCNLVPAVSPMSGSPTFDTEKKRKQKNRTRRIYNSATPYVRAGGVINLMFGSLQSKTFLRASLRDVFRCECKTTNPRNRGFVRFMCC